MNQKIVVVAMHVEQMSCLKQFKDVETLTATQLLLLTELDKVFRERAGDTAKKRKETFFLFF